jgi:hypothetical protein
LDQDGEEDQVIPASQFYRIKDLTPIQGQANSIYAYTEPRQPTGVHQDGSLTYAVDSITLVWNAPVDEGCSEITNYVIEADINGWQEVGQSTLNTGVALLPTRSGQWTNLRVTAENLYGRGRSSDVIELIPASLPSPSQLI